MDANGREFENPAGVDHAEAHSCLTNSNGDELFRLSEMKNTVPDTLPSEGLGTIPMGAACAFRRHSPKKKLHLHGANH